MAYNLQPLITILEGILNPEQTRWIVVDHNKLQLQSLLEKAASLQQILDKSSLPKIETMENQIRDAAHKAEDIVESYMVDQMLSVPQGMSSTLNLQQVMQQLDSVMEQVMKLVEEMKIMTSRRYSLSTDAPSLHDLSSKSVVVGVDEDLMQLKDRLTGTQSKLEIIPIVGMGGVGKTTLALNLYQDPLIVSHFDVRAWSTISQNYNMVAILSSILCCINGQHLDEHSNFDIVHKKLYGRRYMIVLDDIWSTRVWDDIRRYFPDNNNGSRIVITTRESDVAKYADSHSLQHQVKLLSDSESWNLLSQIVLGEEDCSASASDVLLQEIGRKIASDCGGLPLAINVIGGLLSKLERSRDVWENIGIDVRAAIAESEEHEQFSNILSLSYNHLPNYLKPCFLYMGAFPEDYEVKASRLIHLWIAEGFVKSNGSDKSLEEEAEDYLKALVGRNLILVRENNKLNGRVLSYSTHDLLRDICVKKAVEEKFLLAKNTPKFTFTNPRRVNVGVISDNVYASAEFISLARSFIGTGRIWPEILSPFLSALRLLRVLDVKKMKFYEFPREILKLVNLRYLAVSIKSSMPSGISRLSNLQTFIARSRWGNMPSEIWEMPELRHIKWNQILRFEDECEYPKNIILEKLQTISYVEVTRSIIRWGFFEIIPNIKDMVIYYDDLPPRAFDVSHLHKLETLKCDAGLHLDADRFLPTVRFPSNLRNLSLTRCVIFPVVLTTLSALLNLERLSIWQCSFESKEWEITEGDEFRSLQFLSLAVLDVVHWSADEINFPRLRHLHIRECLKLEEIPGAIGDIPTLQLIELEDCSASVVASAKKIQEVQQSDYDNYDLQLRLIG